MSTHVDCFCLRAGMTEKTKTIAEKPQAGCFLRVKNKIETFVGGSSSAETTDELKTHYCT